MVQKVAADAVNYGNDYPNFSFCKPGVDNKKFFLKFALLKSISYLHFVHEASILPPDS